MKKYSLSLICGRFCHMHNGHKLIIDKALNLSEEVLILIGSAQESKTLRNPLDAEYRINLLKKVYGKNSKIKIEKLNDMTNEYDITFDWGQYVIDHTIKYAGRFADLIVTGNDDLRTKWFSKEQMKNTTELLIDRKDLDISATELRGYVLLNDKDSWSKFVPKKILDEFENIREKILEVTEYKEILNKMKDDLSIENFKSIYKKYEQKDKEEKIKQIK